MHRHRSRHYWGPHGSPVAGLPREDEELSQRPCVANCELAEGGETRTLFREHFEEPGNSLRKGKQNPLRNCNSRVHALAQQNAHPRHGRLLRARRARS